MEDEERSGDQAGSGRCMVPSQMRPKVVCGEDSEDNQGDDLLDYLELDGCESAIADAVGGHLKAILEEGDRPTDQDDLPESFVAEAQMSVPGKRHEDVREDEKNNCPHLCF